MRKLPAISQMMLRDDVNIAHIRSLLANLPLDTIQTIEQITPHQFKTLWRVFQGERGRLSFNAKFLYLEEERKLLIMNPSFAHEGFKVSLSRLVSRFLRTLGHDEHMFDFIIATNMGLHFGRMAKPDFQVLIKNNHYLSEHQALAQETCRPVGPGDPLKAHFPTGTRLQEHSDSVEVHEPGRDAVHYRRASHAKSDGHRVMDIIILGEGHSAWGQFNLYGRVRPLDGFMSFSKEYIDGDRARWLYRGYLVGNVNGHISGRWRDTLSPSDLPGYEGCFVMSRRR